MGNLIGHSLGRYQIDALVGRGAMGEVYRGHHTILQREVAIKTIYPHLAADERFVSRFEREATLAAGLRHPNIVQIFDFDVQDGIPYMVMEFVPGPNLKERLGKLGAAGQHMGMPEVLRILEGVASALDYAHGKEMIHRDVKAGNILLTETGDPVLVDFGIARMQEATQITATGAIMGTPAYLSPEQGRGEPADARSDIYSLGIVLYEMIAGCLPFTGDSTTGIIMKHLLEAPPSLRSLRPELPPQAEQVCLKALAKQPDDRYQTGRALADALKAALLAPGTDGGRTIGEARLAGGRPDEQPAPRTPPLKDGAGQPPLGSPAVRDPAGERQVPTQPAQPSARLAAHRGPSASPGGRQAVPWKWIVAGAILIALVAVVGSFIIAANLGVARPTPAPTSAPTSAPAPTPALPGAAFELSVDNAGPGFAIEAGEWGTCWDGECQGVAYGADFRYANPGCTECEARFSLSVPRDGQYDVWAWWPRGDDRATDTPFTIRYAGGELTVTVNQRDDGNGWHRLGRLPFRAAEPAGITVRGSGSGYANADAVALTPP